MDLPLLAFEMSLAKGEAQCLVNATVKKNEVIRKQKKKTMNYERRFFDCFALTIGLVIFFVAINLMVTRLLMKRNFLIGSAE